MSNPIKSVKPQHKIIDAQAIANYIEQQRDPDGNVRASDIIGWLIGANNRIQHNHSRFVNEIEVLKGSDPEIVLALVDRTEYIQLDGKTFRAEVDKFVRSC